MSLTALKNACRQLGLESWPKERSQLLAARRREAWDVREWFGGQEEGIQSPTERTEEEDETMEGPMLNGAPYLERLSGEGAGAVDDEEEEKGFVKVEKGSWKKRMKLQEKDGRRREWGGCRGEGQRELMEEGLGHVVNSIWNR